MFVSSPGDKIPPWMVHGGPVAWSGVHALSRYAQEGENHVGKATRNLLLMALFVGGLLMPGEVLAVMVNQLAPDFTLPSTTGKAITLSQFRGNKMVLIEFYGIDFGVT